jgi:hypothetical protein
MMVEDRSEVPVKAALKSFPGLVPIRYAPPHGPAVAWLFIRSREGFSLAPRTVQI